MADAKDIYLTHGKGEFEKPNYKEMAVAIASQMGLTNEDIKECFRDLSDYSQKDKFSHELVNALITDYRDCNKDDLMRYTSRVGRFMSHKMDNQMSTDAMTGLLRKEAFNKRVNEEKSRLERSLDRKLYGSSENNNEGSHSLTAVMLDVDNFKKYNDTYGHEQGDKALKMVGEVIRKSIRNTDIAGRVGGEEFAIVLPDSNPNSIHEVIFRIYENLKNTPIPVGDINPEGKGHGQYPLSPDKLTVSVGFATFPGNVKRENLDSILKFADDALYIAKDRGRNQLAEYGGLKE